MMPSMEDSTTKAIKAGIDRNGSFDLGSFNLDTKIIILSVITIFINVYLCGAVALLTTIYVLASKEKRLRVNAVPHSRWIFLFSILLFVVPPIYSNWLGLGVGLVFFVIFIYYLYLCTEMTEGLYNTVIDISCMISLIYVLIALFQKLLGVAPRSPSTFQNANYYSYALELIMMMSFYRLATAKTWRHKLFIVVVILANLLALWTADCRSAWPSIFGGLVVLFALNKRTKSLLFLIGIYMVGIKLALSFPSIFPRLDSLEFAESIRTDIWLQALQGISQHLVFGAGALGFYHLYHLAHMAGGPYLHAHDLLLEMLLSFGLLGTGFLVTYFGSTLWDIAKRYKASPLKQIYALIFSCIAVTLIHGIADVTVMWPQTGMLLALILAGGGIAIKSTTAKGAETIQN